MGGSERLVYNLVRGLDRNLFNPSVAWLNESEALQEFQDLHVPLYSIPKVKRVDFSVMRELARIIKRESIDVVNAQHFMPAIYAYYGCTVVAGKVLVFTAHSKWEIEDTPLKWRVVGGYLLRRMGACIGVAPEVSRTIHKVFKTGTSQTVTIENGIDTEHFGAQMDGPRLRRRLDLKDCDVVIGVVANLKSVKNHMFLLEAFAKLAEAEDNAKLLIVGQGFAGEPDNTEGKLRQFVEQHGLAGRVRFLGYRTDVADLLRVMDIFCLPSIREGLPLSVIEAMAASLPVVGTDVEGIRDVITPNRDGILVKLGDVTALKDALGALLRSAELRRKYGCAGVEKVLTRYSLRRCVLEYERLFLSLAGLPVEGHDAP